MTPVGTVVVIGSGPYGLAVGAHLRRKRAPLRIFGSPMETWLRRMPKGMFLKSEGFASSISDPENAFTLRRFCREEGLDYGDYGAPVPIETFTAYGRWFAERAVPDVEDTVVTSVSRRNGGFTVALDSGEAVAADRVVVATGITQAAYLPPPLAGLPTELVTHSSDHVSFDHLHGRSVGVVGAGQSALETAALLHEAGAAPTVIARRPRVLWNRGPNEEERQRGLRRSPFSPLGRGWRLWAYSTFPVVFTQLPADTRRRLAHETLGPAGAWWLRERLEVRVPMHAGWRIVNAAPENGSVRLELERAGESRSMLFDHVIGGTGYRADVARFGFLAPELRTSLAEVNGAPRLTRFFESSARGLYFVGFAAANTFGPPMRFVCGTSFAARRIARHVTGR